MTKISVIIPVYNCEKYLKKCIDSVLSQSFKDLELILIDDGSVDLSGKICDDYKQKDSRVTVIHQENKGVSNARNVGLKEACGEFIGFVDSDDYLAPDMYEFLYNNLKKSGADISICGILNCYIKNDGVISQTRQSLKDGTWILTGEEALGEALKSRLFSVNPVNKLFNSKLFKGRFYPEGKLSEDAFLIPLILSLASKVIYSSDTKYYYVRRENSITTSDFSKADWDVTEAYLNHLNLMREKYPGFIKEAEFRYIWSFTYVLDKIILSNVTGFEKDYKKAIEFVKKNAFKIFINPYFSLRRKLVTLLLLISENFYKNILLKMRKNQ